MEETRSLSSHPRPHLLGNATEEVLFFCFKNTRYESCYALDVATYPVDGVWYKVIVDVPVVFGGRYGRCFNYPAGSVLNSIIAGEVPKTHLVAVVDPAELIRNPDIRTLVCTRRDALGDSIVTLTGMRYLKRLFPHINMVFSCAIQMHPILKCQTEVEIRGSRSKPLKSPDFQISLDGYYELDHSDGCHKVNRLDRFLAIFGVSIG